LVATGKVPEAKQALTELQKADAAMPADYGAGVSNLAKDLSALAITMLKAQIAGAENDPKGELALLREAATKEDKLSYDEPSAWFYPVRHTLGSRLLKSGKASEAEAVYREDLRHNPNNGWALYGLAQALKAQKKGKEAASVEEKFKAAWVRSDITLTSSAL
jgi:tetratricopeptide (TPR) repeat protein